MIADASQLGLNTLIQKWLTNLEITRLWKAVVFKESLNGFKIQWDLGHLIPLCFFESLSLGKGCARGDRRGTPTTLWVTCCRQSRQCS